MQKDSFYKVKAILLLCKNYPFTDKPFNTFF